MRRGIENPAGWSDQARYQESSAGVSSGFTRVVVRACQAFLILVLFFGSAAFFAGQIEADGVSEAHFSLADAAPPVLPAAIKGILFSPDGQLLATCGDQEAIEIWNVAALRARSHNPPQLLRDETARHAMAFSPDSSMLVAAGEKSLTIWKRHGESFAFDREDDTTTHRCLAFSADGRTLALGGDDGLIRLWDMPSRVERRVLRGHVDVVRSLSFSPDGKRLLSSGQDRQAILWDLADGKPNRSTGGSGPGSVLIAAFSPDGHSFAIAECAPAASPIALKDLETGENNALEGHTLGVNALTFSHDGRLLASAGNDGLLYLWNPVERKVVTKVVEENRNIFAVALSSDSTMLAYGCHDGRIGFRDLAANTRFTIDRR